MDLPRKSKEYVLFLSEKYEISISDATTIYLMGEEKHSEVLCNLKSKDFSDQHIQFVNNGLWEDYFDEKNEELKSNQAKQAWQEFIEFSQENH